jgi:hypothetical protein
MFSPFCAAQWLSHASLTLGIGFGAISRISYRKPCNGSSESRAVNPTKSASPPAAAARHRHSRGIFQKSHRLAATLKDFLAAQIGAERLKWRSALIRFRHHQNT